MTSPPDSWKPGEKRLREKEVRRQGWAITTQMVASLATVAAVVVALAVAYQGQQSYKTTTQYNLQQSQDNQLSTALTSLGSSDVTERIAGLVLLRLNAADRLTPESSAVFGEQNAFSHYTTALEIYGGYLRSHGMDFLASVRHAKSPFGQGYGPLPPPGFSPDIQYALDELRQLLYLRKQVSALTSTTPSIDLAADELYENNLTGMDFSWVHAYMVGIDLRGAVMEGVYLSGLDHLDQSYLQCADLRGAHLQGAHMEYADLRGADLTGADLHGTYLTGADLRGADISGTNFSKAHVSRAKLNGMYGTTNGLPPGTVTSATQPPGQSSCLANMEYWDIPKTNPTPIPSQSATPLPTATLKK